MEVSTAVNTEELLVTVIKALALQTEVQNNHAKAQYAFNDAQLKAQAEQTKAQAEQAKAQAEQAKAHTAAYVKLEQRIISFENTVVRKLEIIEANTVTIMGMQIQDFNGIAPETKVALEEAGDEIAQNQSLVEFIEVVEADDAKTSIFR
jgi:hypothetical protein